jgi:hypothetical protein
MRKLNSLKKRRKSKMGKTSKRFLALAVLFLILGIGRLDAATITFDPFNPTVLQGQAFHINIVGQDFPATTGGDVLVEWNSNLLSLTSTTITWPGDLKPAVIPTTPGSVSLSVGNFAAANPSGNFSIADLFFTASALNLGDSFFTITTSFWADANGSEFSPQPTALGGTVRVDPVPIPGAVWLLGGGLVSLVALRRRK